jgi:transposase
MAKHRTHSIEFKRQVAQEFLAGETLHGLAKRHDICRNLIRVWVQNFEAGEFDEDGAAADLLQNTKPGSRRSSVWSASRHWSSSF